MKQVKCEWLSTPCWGLSTMTASDSAGNKLINHTLKRYFSSRAKRSGCVPGSLNFFQSQSKISCEIQWGKFTFVVFEHSAQKSLVIWLLSRYLLWMSLPFGVAVAKEEHVIYSLAAPVSMPISLGNTLSPKLLFNHQTVNVRQKAVRRRPKCLSYWVWMPEWDMSSKMLWVFRWSRKGTIILGLFSALFDRFMWKRATLSYMTCRRLLNTLP